MASDIPQFNVVCEGPADYYVIEAALAGILDDADFILQRIQPPESMYGGSAGPFGGGWKGVKAWCESIKSTWGSFASGRSSIVGSLLIIHIDADVASENEIGCALPCPLAENTVIALWDVLLEWMGDATVPSWVVFCIPSKDTDAWVLVSLYPEDDWAKQNIECRFKPAEHLVSKPEKLVRRRDGSIQKNSTNYAKVRPQIAKSWPTIKHRCREAARFEVNLLAALQ